MKTDLCRRLFGSSPVAHMATIGTNGPHIVPIVFALEGEVLYTAVDHKPKRTTSLRRLENIRAEPRVSILVDHYTDDWTRLWWVRADGVASIVDDEVEKAHGLDQLAGRYEQYRDRRPTGPLMMVRISTWTGWSAS